MTRAGLLRPEELAAWLCDLMPFRGGRYELGPASLEGFVHESEQGHLIMTLNLISWDVDEAAGTSAIRDIKQQDVFAVDAAYRDEPERVRAFLEAWASIMPEVLERAAEIDCMMPYDLVNFGPLSLARAESRDDFRRALLVKSRYGRWLNPPRT